MQIPLLHTMLATSEVWVNEVEVGEVASKHVMQIPLLYTVLVTSEVLSDEVKVDVGEGYRAAEFGDIAAIQNPSPCTISLVTSESKASIAHAAGAQSSPETVRFAPGAILKVLEDVILVEDEALVTSEVLDRVIDEDIAEVILGAQAQG